MLIRQTASAGVERDAFLDLVGGTINTFISQFTGAVQIRVTLVFATLVEITLA